MLFLKVDIDEVMKGLEVFRDDQLPFVIAKSLTKVAQLAQDDVRWVESGRFRLRNDWTTRNTKITPATKQTLLSEVYTDTSNRASGAPDYLEGQQAGYEKVPHNGRQHIAVPTKYLRQLAGGENRPIPDWLRPNALLKYAETAQTSRFGTYGTRTGRTRNQPKVINGMYFFKVTLKSGAGCILARHVADRRDVVYPMYMLVTQANVRKRFPMEETVAASVERHFEQEFLQVLQETHPLEL